MINFFIHLSNRSLFLCNISLYISIYPSFYRSIAPSMCIGPIYNLTIYILNSLISICLYTSIYYVILLIPRSSCFFKNHLHPDRRLSSLSPSLCQSPIANLLFCCDGVGHLGILVNKYTITRWNNIEKHLFGEGNKLTS